MDGQFQTFAAVMRMLLQHCLVADQVWLFSSHRLRPGPQRTASRRRPPPMVILDTTWGGYRDWMDLPNFCLSSARACADTPPELTGVLVTTRAGAGMLGKGSAAADDSNPTQQYSS